MLEMTATSAISTSDLKKNMIVLNQTNTKSISPHKAERKMLLQGHLWHKIIVHNASHLNREDVLKSLLNSVHPLDLIPVNYTIDGENASFMVRNCRRAIEKLCRDNLIVENQFGNPFILTVILGYSNTAETQLNVQNNIIQTINKRFNNTTKVLNLNQFHSDEALSQLIFCVLSQPKILYFVLHLSKSLNTGMTSLILSNNELKSVNSLQAVWSVKSLKTLDLRNNLIENMVSLRVLKNMYLTELWLDGNPVCENYYDEAGYIMAVKDVCPFLEKLDGVTVKNKGFIPFRRNYLQNRECQEFVDQFLRHFFTLYDLKDRKCLLGLYHEDAIFSLTTSYVIGQSTSDNVKLDIYKRYTRNLKKISDFSRNADNLFIGRDKILDLFVKLPVSEHDPCTFACDTPLCSLPSRSVVIVNGAFREPTSKLLDVECIYGFSRMFVLQEIDGTGEYKIINEMLHISNANTNLAQRAFQKVKVPVNITPSLKVPTSKAEQFEMIEVFVKLTTIKKTRATRYLEMNQWDLKKALVQFKDDYQLNRLPKSSFRL